METPLNAARRSYQAGDAARAAALCRQALRDAAADADAWGLLGAACRALGKAAEAADAYRRAVGLRPGHADAHAGLAGRGRPAEAVGPFREALRLRPGHAPTHHNLGNVYKDRGRFAEAQASYQIALWHSPDQASTHWSRSLAWLQASDYEQGWAEYEWRWRRPPSKPRQLPKPVWDGSPLAGRTLLIHMEQGLGDMIQFVRYALLVKGQGGRVVVECSGFLVGLFASCPGIDRLVAEGEALPDYDVHLPVMSLPHRLGTTLDTVPAEVPYLAAPPERVERWGRELAGLAGFKVGVVWQGNPHHPWDRHRSVPLAAFAPLAGLPGVTLVSLQKGQGARQLGTTRAVAVHDLGPDLDPAGGFLDTAAVMKHLDLVVAADTAAAHLAGALGVPVWLALSAISDWRWLTGRDDAPWYPTLRLFRQTTPGDWRPVFDRMRDELRAACRTSLTPGGDGLLSEPAEILSFSFL